MKGIVKGAIISIPGALLLAASVALSSATDLFPSSVKCNTIKTCFTAQNSGSGNAIKGQANSGVGLYGLSKLKYGVYGTSPKSYGVAGQSSSGIGVHGQSSSGTGVYGISDSGAGVYGFAGNGNGGYFQNSADTTPTLQAVAYGYGAPTGLMVSQFSGSQLEGYFVVQGAGNGEFTGEVTAAGYMTKLRTRGGDGNVGAFNAESTRASIEDVGTARLTNGEGAVRFGPRFASTIDTSRGYQVFLTPDGDTRGLYVAAKYEDGFVVREVEHGRSSLDFDYRIVAHPYGASDARLPRINIKLRQLQPPPAIDHPQP